MSGSNGSSLWRNAADWVSIQIAAVQGSLNRLINTAEGSFTLALSQASGSVALYLQNQIIKALLMTRAATCFGSDLDSFYAQFQFFRLAATFASGLVTFARASAVYAASIPVGSIVTTGVSGTQFQVIADTGNSFWDPTVGGSGGFTLPAGTSSGNIPVQAVTAGISGNVGATTINTMVQPITYIDTVSNAVAFTNGVGAELDAAFTARFRLWINSRSLGVEAAIRSAVLSVQQGLSMQIVGNAMPGQATGTTPGTYTVYVDNGTGATPSGLISLIFAAVDAVNGFTIEPYVVAATPIEANIGMGVEVAQGFTFASVSAQIIAGLATYGATLGVGDTLPYFKIPQIAIDSSSGIELLSSVTLNSLQADLIPAVGQIIQIPTPSITQVGS